MLLQQTFRNVKNNSDINTKDITGVKGASYRVQMFGKDFRGGFSGTLALTLFLQLNEVKQVICLACHELHVNKQ